MMGGELGSPGRIGQHDHRPAQIERDGRQQQIHRRYLFGRQEQRPGPDHGDGRPQDQPGLAAPEAGRRAVRQDPDQRIGDHIPDARKKQDSPDRCQPEAEIIGIEGRDDDKQRQQQHGQRQARQAIDQQLQVCQGAHDEELPRVAGRAA